MIAALILLGLAVIALAVSLVLVDRRHARNTLGLAKAIAALSRRTGRELDSLAIEIADVKRAIDRTLEDTAPIDIADIPTPLLGEPPP